MKKFGLLAAPGITLSIGAVSAHDGHMHPQSSTTTTSIDDDSFDVGELLTATGQLDCREIGPQIASRNVRQTRLLHSSPFDSSPFDTDVSRGDVVARP